MTIQQIPDWTTALDDARNGLALLDGARAALTEMGDAATAEMSKYLRTGIGVALNPDAIRATLTRPYTLVPINEHEAWLIHWRGVEMPIFGWVTKQEPAFTIARITRTMDLLTPLPGWMRDELGWKPPAHGAMIDGTRTALRVTAGDESSFKRRYGAHLGARQADGSYRIRPGDAWIKLVAQLVRDGILPYTPQPVADEHWNERAESTIQLRDYQQPALDAFREKGAILINYPPGAGKTFIVLKLLAHFVGRVLLLADTVILVEQWRDRLAKFAPNANVIVSTYQGAGKYLNLEWDLLIADEAQRLPANTFSRLAFVKTKYRIGLTGTPWREDDRQFLIVALSGFPVAMRWSDLIRSGVLKRPRIVVATVADERGKAAYVKSLLARRKGRAIIFCDWIEQGKALAGALDVPFIHGETANKLALLMASDVAVVSRVVDRGLDLPDLRLVVEVAGAGAAREQFAQRVGRLLHGAFAGEFHTVFTPDEAERYRARIFGVEAELAGEIDIEFVNIGNVPADEARVHRPRPAPRARAVQTAKPAPSQGQAESVDEISQMLALPSVAAKLSKASVIVGARTAPYLRRMFWLCYSAPFAPGEIAEGLGITDAATVSRMRSACKALLKVGLFTGVAGEDGTARFRVNGDEIGRLRALAKAVK